MSDNDAKKSSQNEEETLDSLAGELEFEPGKDATELESEELASSWERAERIVFADSNKSRIRAQRVRPPSRTAEDADAVPQASAADLAGIEKDVEEQLKRNESLGIILGEAEQGWIEAEVSEEGEQAYLRALDFGDDKSITKETVLNSLRDDYDIKFGIDEDAVAELVARAAAGEALRENVLIAQDKPPVPGEPGRIEYPFLEGLGAEQTLPFWELYTAFEKRNLDELLKNCSLARMVCPGDTLAVEIPPTEGTPGTDVRGEPHTIPGQPASLEIGANVSVSDEGFLADIYGYVCVIRDKLSVISPVWISPDKMEAYFIHFPQLVPPSLPQSEWIVQLLEIKEIRHGIQESAIERLCQQVLENRAHANLIASGRPAVDGTDTRIEYTFDPQKRPGTYLPDGTIDLRQRNVIIGVKKDQLLGELKAAAEGQNGMNIRGEEIPAKDGEKKTFKGGGNVRIEEENGIPRFFYAGITGSVKIQEGAIKVEPIHRIDGPVDYETGNIDVPIDIYIKGSVLSGFKVKSEGNIIIGGTVENGAEVRARGDVAVSGGIVGRKTKVIAQGYLETKLIQNSQVIANGDIRVGSYIYNGSVRSGGKITVNAANDKRGGSIVSGQVHAAKGIEAKHLGSASTDRTLVGLREPPQVEFRRLQLGQNLGKCNDVILRVLRTLGLQEVNADLLRRCLKRAPHDRKKKIAEMIQFLQEAVQKKQELLETQQELEKQIESDLQNMKIRVLADVFPDVTIQIGINYKNISEKISCQTFMKQEEEITWKPL